MELYKNKEWLQYQLNNIKYAEKIGKLAGVSGDTITYWRKKFNIQKPDIKPQRKYSFDDTYFDNINNPVKSYWLGFIMADGCVSSSTSKKIANRFSIVLKQSDIDHLKKIAKDMKCHAPIITKEHIDKRGFTSYSCELRINSQKLCNSLIKLGVIPNKTGKEQIPSSLDRKYYTDFIRGFFDGDGCLTKTLNRSYYRFHVGSCSEKIIKQIQLFLKEHGIIIPTYIRNEYSKPFYMLETSCKKTCNDMLHLLYDNSETYLDRKYILVQDMFKICSLK